MAKKPKDKAEKAEKKKEAVAKAAPAPVVKAPVVGKGSADTLKTIAQQVKAKKAAQAAVDAAVIKARGEGSSWVQIAAALAISPQGARQKYLPKIPA
ncbi:MAG: hypothetical protein LBS56_05605 [Propionibacteriaceae bacterium]|jgi:hypothetical protein|nr:hypothetical protein [Propionibacteriaceae bacterium]